MTDMLKRMRHGIAHRLGLNTGGVVAWMDFRGRAMIGFRCAECQRVQGIHPSVVQLAAEIPND